MGTQMNLFDLEDPNLVEGTINRMVHYRQDTGFAIFKLTDGTQCLGTVSQLVTVGTKVKCKGYWKDDLKWGRQFMCKQVLPEMPTADTSEGAIQLLTKLPTIGPVKATNLVKQYGPEKAWDLAQVDPAKLGIPARLVDEVKDLAFALIADYEAWVYLLGIGCTSNQAQKIIAHYGPKAIEVVSQRPFELISTIDGFGFIKVDEIAFKAGMHSNSQARISAGVVYILENSEKNDGHTYHHAGEIKQKTYDLLIESTKKNNATCTNPVQLTDVYQAIVAMGKDGYLYLNDKYECALYKFKQAEEHIEKMMETRVTGQEDY